LPAPKPRISEIEARNHDAKGKADSTSVGEIASRGKQKSSLAPKSKTQAKKQNGKGKAAKAKRQRQSGGHRRRRGWESGGRWVDTSRPHAKAPPVI
jgi:hypothetical protein